MTMTGESDGCVCVCGQVGVVSVKKFPSTAFTVAVTKGTETGKMHIYYTRSTVPGTL